MKEKLFDSIKKIKLLNFMGIIIGVFFILSIIIVSTDSYTQGYIRKNVEYSVVDKDDYTLNYRKSDIAPQGIIKEYRFTLDEIRGDAVIAFYNIHNYIRVYIDNELAYRMEPDKSLPIGKSLGLSWASVPLNNEDAGKEVLIELVPVYKNIIDQEQVFDVGPELEIFRDVFLAELPIFILSIFSILIGILLIIMSIVYKMRMKLVETYPFYLGLFAILIGLWKSLELPMAPIIFPFYTKLIFHLSFSSLAFLPAVSIMYLKELVKNYDSSIVKRSSYVIHAITIVLFFLQLIGIRDLRESIILIHLMIIYIILLVIYFNIYIYFKKIKGDRKLFVLTLIFSLSAIIDISLYVKNVDSRNTYFTFIVFLVYSLVIGIQSLSENSRKAYVDIFTELFNRSYCQQVIERDIVPSDNSKAIIMMDLNYLKYTNDMYGHDEGDKLIKDFADAIRPENNHYVQVGRFGGDEFLMIIRNVSEEEILNIEKRVRLRVDAKNKKRTNLISYAFGYSYSKTSDKSYQELYSEADQKMYQNKHKIKTEDGFKIRRF